MLKLALAISCMVGMLPSVASADDATAFPRKLQAPHEIVRTGATTKRMVWKEGRVPIFLVENGHRGARIANLKVTIVLDPDKDESKDAEERTDTFATVSYWLYNGAASMGRPVAMTFTATDREGKSIGGKERGAPFLRTYLPAWRCWYNGSMWTDDNKVEEKDLPLAKGSFYRIDTITVDFSALEGAAGCRGGGSTGRVARGD